MKTIKHTFLITLLLLIGKLAVSQTPCTLGNYGSFNTLSANDYPHTTTSGITVNATTSGGVSTLNNFQYDCNGTPYNTAPPAWWLNNAAQSITLTFSQPVASFSVIVNGTNTNEEFYFDVGSVPGGGTGCIQLSDFCMSGDWNTINGGTALIYTGTGASSTLITINNPGGVTSYTMSHNGVGAGSRIAVVDCFVAGGGGGTGTVDVDPLPNQTMCGSFTFPAITGSGLSGNEAYYDGPSGTGNQYNPNDIYSITGTNTIYIYDPGSGCGNDEESFDITINTTPDITNPGNQIACDSYTLPAINGTNLTGNEAYYDAPNGGGSQYNSGDNITTTTTLYIYDETGSTPNCSDEESFVVTINTTPTVDPINDQTVCNNVSTTAVNFTGTAGATYNWVNDNTAIGLAANGTGNIGAFTATNGTNAPISGTITVTPSSNGCTGTSESFTITVNPTPQIDAGPDDDICDGDQYTLTANNPDGANISWDNGVTDGTPFTPGSTTTYTVDADLNGCTNSDDVTITVNPNPNYNLAGSDPTTCGGNDGSITVSGLDPNTDYDISYDDNGTPIGSTTYTSDASGVITISNLDAGTYDNFDIAYTLTGCNTINNNDIILNDPAGPTVDPVNDQTVCNNTNTTAVNFTGTAGSTYSWTNDNTNIGLAANGNGNIAAFTATNGTNAPITGTITVTPTLAGCVGNTESFTITVNPTPQIDAGPDDDVCDGDQYTLTANNPDGANISWDNGITDGTPFTPGSTTTYTVDADLNGCTNADNVTITVIPLPAFTFSGTDPTTCGGNDGTLIISGLSPNTSYDVEYSDAGNPVASSNYTSDGAGEITINGLSAGSYSDVIVTNTTTGCTGSDNSSINLAPPNSPSVNAGPDQVICNDGSTVTLTANNPDGANISWSNGVTDGVAFTPANTGINTYTVTADLNGCIATDQVQVTLNPLPNVVANASNNPICEGDNVILTGSGASNYSWDNSVNDGQAFAPNSTTTYTVTGTDNNGCQNTDQITITVNSLPTVNFTSPDASGCEPLKVKFNSNTSSSNTCTWDFGDGATATTCNSAFHEYYSTGCFDVSLTVTDNNGCTNTEIKSDFVCVDPKPIAAFTQNHKLVTLPETEVSFTNGSIGADGYTWNFYDYANSLEENPTHKFPEEADKYQVTLTATTTNGCSDEATSYVIVQEDLLFYVPNTFTPDGDNYNETFRPVMTSGYDPYKYKLLIFNRWGEILFESNNSQIGWDGTFQGNLVQDGTYVWKIVIHDPRTDERKEFNGHVNVLK